MANLKNITELPVAESADGLNLIVNDNGAAKQIAASAVGAQADFNVTDENSPAFIKNKPEIVQADWTEADKTSPAFVKNKPTKELVYEWNFSADDEVYEINENVDEDLAWLTTISDDTGWEIVISTYGCYERYDEDSDEWNEFVDPGVEASIVTTSRNYAVRYQNGEHMKVNVYGFAPEDFRNDWELGYYDIYNYVCVYNRAHFDENSNMTSVGHGGNIYIIADDGGPFKSIKIYKTT